MSRFKDRRVTVVGLARSGMAAATLLNRLGALVSITEKNTSVQLEASGENLRKDGMEVELGGHSRAFIEGRDLVVVSPGVVPEAEPIIWANESRIEVISEIELASSLCPAPIIAVTGTNGKTTTTTLIAEVLRASGYVAHALGNIGSPFSQEVLRIKKGEFVSLEISSFQLEHVQHFHPRFALILNITPDHLDRHKNFTEYLRLKKRIFENQDRDDWLIVNYADEVLREAAGEARAKVLFFNKDETGGGFNQNQLAVLAVAEALGIKKAICLEVFRNFKGVEHRMELIRTLNGIDFINDSKATNIDSTIWALNNITKPAVLIAGGREKGSDFSRILDLARSKVKFAVLVGEASGRIAGAWKGFLPFAQATTFEDAVALSYQKAKAGDCVLLSPMAKSFDMFTDYEHRGRVFKELVNHLK